MRTLMIYSEVLNPSTLQWECEQTDTFQRIDECYWMQPVVDTMFYPDLLTVRFCNILAMGFTPTQSEQPYGFGSQSLPPNTSDVVQQVYQTSRAEYPGWRTKAEFLGKATDLLAFNTPESLGALSEWTAFLKHLPNHSELNDDHHRFIYWFAR